jgi:hypothetical protein
MSARDAKVEWIPSATVHSPRRTYTLDSAELYSLVARLWRFRPFSRFERWAGRAIASYALWRIVRGAR